jgi:hypothetical protein
VVNIPAGCVDWGGYLPGVVVEEILRGKIVSIGRHDRMCLQVRLTGQEGRLVLMIGPAKLKHEAMKTITARAVDTPTPALSLCIPTI